MDPVFYDSRSRSLKLLYKFTSQWSLKLLYKFTSQWSLKLLYKFTSQWSLKLLYKFTSQLSLKLLYKFTSQWSLKLLYKFTSQSVHHHEGIIRFLSYKTNMYTCYMFRRLSATVRESTHKCLEFTRVRYMAMVIHII